MDKWTILALCLIFIGNIGGILIVIVQSNNSSKDKDQIIQTTENSNKSLKQDLAKIQKEREQLQQGLEKRDNEIKAKTEEIIQLNRELFSQSDELNKFLGASDIYPTLKISIGGSERGVLGFTFKIYNEFKYPLYDVELNVFDFQFILNNSRLQNNTYALTQENFAKSIIYQFDVEQIAGGSNLITPKLFHISNGILYVKLKCRNNIVFEKIAFVEVNNVIYHGYMIYNAKGEILKRSDNFSHSEEIRKKIQDKFDQIPLDVSMRIIN